jgi:hypothetical protein
MAVDYSNVGLTFPSKRLSRAAQAIELRAAGASNIIDVGVAQCKSWRTAVRRLRGGETVHIVGLVIVPTEPGGDDVIPSGQPSEFILEVHNRRATVLETRTGLKSSKSDDRRKMIAAASKSLRSGGRLLPPSGKPAGRPHEAFNDDALAHNREIWFSRDVSTNGAAERLFKGDMTKEQAKRRWGASGRPWPTRRQRK